MSSRLPASRPAGAASRQRGSTGAPSRRCRASAAVAPPPAEAAPQQEQQERHAPLRVEADADGVERLAYDPAGWRWWTWRGHRLHYVASGDYPSEAAHEAAASTSGRTPVVLIHGFGASSYHWRYQLPALSAVRPTYALCMVGYGLSAKPGDLAYSAELWGECVADFVEQVVRRPALLVGNSIGAIAVLNAAFERPALVAGLALLNAAGRFDSGGGARLPPPPPLVPSTPLELISDAGARIAAHAVFLFTKYRVRQVLSSVYVNKGRVDEALVASIYDAACDPSAAEAFFRISGAGGRSVRTLDALLDAAKAAGPLPLALVWGLRDPWMQPAKAAQIVAYYPTADPHDDAPAETNAALLRWAASLDAARVAAA